MLLRQDIRFCIGKGKDCEVTNGQQICDKYPELDSFDLIQPKNNMATEEYQQYECKHR